MTRPTRRAVLFHSVGFAAAAAPILIHPGFWIMWLIYVAAILGALIVDAFRAPGSNRLDVTFQGPGRLFIGESDDAGVRLSIRGGGEGRFELRVDVGEILQPIPDQTIITDASGEGAATLTLIARRRGIAIVETIWVRWIGPLGLMELVKRVPINEEIPVAPNTRAVRAAALRFFSSREFLVGQKTEHYVGDGSEFDSLREYLPGLDHRAMDWKASARLRKLMCREFRAERNHHVIIAYDTGRLMGEPIDGIPRLDHAINAGLLLTYCSLKTGDRVGTFAFDDRVRNHLEPVGGVHAMHRFQQMSASLEYGENETNFTLGLSSLGLRMRKRSLVVIITEFVDTVTAELMIDNLARMARRHLVLFCTLRDRGLEGVARGEPRSPDDVERAVVASDLLRDRSLVQRRLQRLGITCLDVYPDKLSTELLNRYLEIKRRERV